MIEAFRTRFPELSWVTDEAITASLTQALAVVAEDKEASVYEEAALLNAAITCTASNPNANVDRYFGALRELNKRPVEIVPGNYDASEEDGLPPLEVPPV